MRKIKAFTLSVFLISSLLSFSKDYYIGERISLKLTGDIAKEEIEESLKDYKIYKIEKISEKDSVYNVIFASLSTGQKEVLLGNKKLKWNVISTLKDEKDIYPEFEKEENRYVQKDYPYLSIFSGLFGIVLLIAVSIKHLIDRAKNPYLIFKKGISKTTSDNWKEHISLELRRVIDNLYSANFLGGEYRKINSLTDEDIKFIKRLDYIKFSPNKDGDYLDYKKKAIDIVQRIRKEKGSSV
ncbi:MAG: hypothetical protein ACRCZR_07925 [Cetobacterium sp.]